MAPTGSPERRTASRHGVSRSGQWLVDAIQEDRLALFRVPAKRDNELTVVGHKGQVRNLFPFPCSRTDDGTPNCKLAMRQSGRFVGTRATVIQEEK